MSYLSELTKLVDAGKNPESVRASAVEKKFCKAFVHNLLQRAVWVTYDGTTRPKDFTVVQCKDVRPDVPMSRIDMTMLPALQVSGRDVVALAQRVWRNGRADITKTALDNMFDVRAAKATLGAQLGRSVKSRELEAVVECRHGDADIFWTQQRVRVFPLRRLLIIGNAVEHKLIPTALRPAIHELCKEYAYD